MKGLEEIFPGEQGPVLLTSPQAIFYTTGFYTTARRPNQIGNQCVLMDEQFTLFFCPRNWGDVIRPQLDSQITLIPCDPSPAALAEAVCRALPRKPERLGLEEETIILPLYLALREQLPETSLWDVTSRLYRARMKKTPAEIAGLRRSANLAKEAMEHACDILRPGVAELDVVAELEYFMRKNGSEGTPFTMKVLSGDNALRTINLPGTRKLAQGEIVLLDFGTTVGNYASDWTRSFMLGQPTREQQALYELVWRIERTCINRIRPGISLQSLMDTAFDVLRGHPFETWFNPYLGHSIGIDSVERPAIVPGVQGCLEENMVLTIEPGVYVPGVGVIRIEDEILVTSEGPEILTGLRTERFVL